MEKLFNKMLVPVDFSTKSKTAIEKAVDIAKQFNCSIHLVHIVTISPFSTVVMAEGRMAIPYSIIDNKSELEFKLQKYCDYVRIISENTVEVDCLIQKGTWDDTIIDLVNQNKFDLVLIGQKGRFNGKRKMLLNPDKIAEKTNIPVITIPSNRRLANLCSLVIPITDFLPVKKLMYGIYLASGHNASLKLLGIENEKTKDHVKYYMKKAYQLINDNCNIKVELDLIVSDNVAEAVNQFAMLHSADLIILNPGTQTKMPGFFSSFFGNIIQKYSAPPVLTVNPV